MSLWKDWKEFYELTKNKPPRKLLIKATPFVIERNTAFDLGAGALNDSIYLLSEKFSHIIAVDSAPIAEEIAKELPSEKFSYEISSLENFNFPDKTADIVNAQYILPFIQASQFNNVWKKIENTLKVEGIFTGQLFGDKDEWNGSENMTFHTKAEAINLFANFEVLDFEEEEADKPTAAGIMKHWHVFHFILRKS